jgi:adenylosuccinate synthase
MKIDILLGLQWGMKAREKLFCHYPGYDIIARFQGGPNAGHSLEFNNVKHVLHLIPSGIFHPDKLNIIGNWVVIDPSVFKKENQQSRNRPRRTYRTTYNLLQGKTHPSDAQDTGCAYESRKGKQR